MRRILLKRVQDLLRRRPQYVVDLVDLVQLVVAREQWKKRQYLEKDAADAPNVHLVPIMSICHQALRRAVPTSGYVLCQRWLAVKSSATSQVCQFDRVAGKQNVLPTEARYPVE